MKLTAHEKKKRTRHCPVCHVDPGAPCFQRETAHPRRLRGPIVGDCNLPECRNLIRSWAATLGERL